MDEETRNMLWEPEAEIMQGGDGDKYPEKAPPPATALVTETWISEEYCWIWRNSQQLEGEIQKQGGSRQWGNWDWKRTKEMVERVNQSDIAHGISSW